MQSQSAFPRRSSFHCRPDERQQAAALIAHAPDARVARAGHIALRVADEIGARLVDGEFLAGAVDEAGARLAAGAGLRVLRHAAVRVMRAVVEGVEVGAAALQFDVHPVVDAYDVALRIVAARDAALVRDEDREVAAVVDVFDGLLRAGDPLEVLRPVQVVDVDVERAVAVEKDGFRTATPACICRRRCTAARLRLHAPRRSACAFRRIRCDS